MNKKERESMRCDKCKKVAWHRWELGKSWFCEECFDHIILHSVTVTIQ